MVVSLLAVGLLVLATAVRGQAPPEGTLTLTAADNGTTANAHIGQSVLILLSGCPDGGYQWVLTNLTGDSVLTNGPSTFTPDQPGLIGGCGTFYFPLVATQPGDTAVALAYLQPWVGTPVQTFAVTIHVLPPSLSITRADTSVVISWPMRGSTNFFLEGTTTVAPARWAALNVLPMPQGTNYVVTLGAGGCALFFRLHRL